MCTRVFTANFFLLILIIDEIFKWLKKGLLEIKSFLEKLGQVKAKKDYTIFLVSKQPYNFTPWLSPEFIFRSFRYFCLYGLIDTPYIWRYWTAWWNLNFDKALDALFGTLLYQKEINHFLEKIFYLFWAVFSRIPSIYSLSWRLWSGKSHCSTLSYIHPWFISFGKCC